MVGIIALIITTPLMLIAFGYGATDMIAYQKDMQEMQMQLMQGGGDPEAIIEAYTSQFANVSFGLFGLIFVLALFIYGWAINLFYGISDNEIRNGKPDLIGALKNSFNSRIFRIAGFLILYALIQIATTLIFIFICSLLVSVSKALGVLVGFVGFLFLIVFFLRFSIGLAAMVHGNKGIVESISFSLSNLNWKRGWMLFLLGLISMIGLIILSIVIASAFGGNPESISMSSYVIAQLFGLVINGIFIAYLIAATSTLYFRYSDDNLDEEGLEQHIVD